MKAVRNYLVCFSLGGIVGFIINFTWSFQQNMITFSVASILYLLVGYFFNRSAVSFFTYRLLLMFWYILLLLIYSSLVNYSWDLPALAIVCLVSYKMGYYLTRDVNKKGKGLILLLFLTGIVIWLCFFVPWITYKNNTSPMDSSASIRFEFVAASNEDSLITSQDLRGKVVLLDFWFKNCGACMRQYPQMEKVYKYFQSNKDLCIFWVNNGIDSLSNIRELIDKRDIEIPVLIDKGGLFVNRIGIYEYPQYILIDRSGKIVERHIGYSIDEAMVFEDYTIAKISSLLQGK